MICQNSEELLNVLASTPKGEARAQILNEAQNRILVLSSGSSVTIYSGEIKEGSTVKERLSSTFIMVMKRRNARTGAPDGLGTLGGMGERTNPLDFYNLSEDKKADLVGKKDDVILQDGKPTLTKDIKIICENNTLREAQEELHDLNINDVNLNYQDFEAISINGLKDDNFITNIWDGKGQVFAVNPYCHIFKAEESFIDKLKDRSTLSKPGQTSEAIAIDKKPLFAALSCFGNQSGTHRSEDGRNMQQDYRYPHEWMMTWVIASKQLNSNPEQMIQLAQEVQASSSHLVDFDLVAKKMKVEPSAIAKTLGISTETFAKMQDTMQKTYNQQQLKKSYLANTNRLGL